MKAVAWCLWACLVLCGVYAGLAWRATGGKSATFDEPSHVVIGWLMLHDADFRPSPDVPPLWEYWISLPLGREALHPDVSALQGMRTASQATVWAARAMYQTPGVDAMGAVRGARGMALILSTMLGVAIAWWSWKLGGGAAAIGATAAWAFNPTFLGHGALAKNDVAFTLAWTGMAIALWSVGRRVTIGGGVGLSATVALAVGIKLTGLLCGPVVGIVLLSRAVMGEPWMVLGRELAGRGQRAIAALGLCLVVGIVAYTVLWASYGFRFSAGPDGVHGNSAYLIEATRYQQIYRDNGWQAPTADQLARWRPDVETRWLRWSLDHRVVPEAWVEGFLLTRVGMIGRESFLLGQTYRGGHWYYFPLAAVFKTPLAMLAGLILSMPLLAGCARDFGKRWAMLTLLVPAAAYGSVAMGSSMNLGIRYVLPVFPPLFVVLGVAAGHAWNGSRPRISRPVVVGLGCVLAIESLAAFPDYIAYFNVASGGERGGRRLLSDSNLDWGQDLPLLAQWQREHPDVVLYLQYAGTCDPAVYGIRYVNVPGGYVAGPAPRLPDEPGVVAISMTALQAGDSRTLAGVFKNVSPFEVLGGTIALFRFPLDVPR